MDRKQLRKAINKSINPAINIASDGYDYFVQILHEDKLSLLTDKHGKREMFRNLGEAQEILRELGIHQAVFSHALPHDETIDNVHMTQKSQECHMPLWF